MNMLLHNTLCNMGLFVCAVVGAECALWLLCNRFGGIVNILDKAICKAQAKREKRRLTDAFYVENIPGTNGYRIKTR